MENNKRLGRGLEQLFNSESLFMDNLENEIKSETTQKDIVQLKLSELRSNPYQPRKMFDMEKLTELANSIKEYGVLEPIIVTKAIRGYNIVAGERRKKASELAGLETIPAIIKDFSDKDMMEIALLENIQREDLSAIEEAEAYQNIITTLNITQDELAIKLGKSRTHITNMLGLLKLPAEVKNEIMDGNISMGHARVLSKLSDTTKILELCNKIKEQGISVRELEKIISMSDIPKNNPIKRVNNSPYKYVESNLREIIGTKVKISNNSINIPFDSEKDLERILEILRIDVKIDE